MFVREIIFWNIYLLNKEENIMAKKGVPKKDGSGKGKKANKGRGGCNPTQKKGKGSNRK